MRNPKFLGVYSQNQGAASRGRKTLYFIWRLPDDSFAIQELDQAFMAAGPIRRIASSMLKANFRQEPSILAAPVSTPDFRGLVQPKAARSEATELTDEALRELEYARKAKQVENDLRANFSRALRALNRPRDRKGAIVALEQLARTTKGIVPTHKHMFRDFGVSLRKKSLPDLAAICAGRALELAPNDDHAHFNFARVLAMLGKYDDALAHLKAAKKLDASEKVYERLAEHIREERSMARSKGRHS